MYRSFSVSWSLFINYWSYCLCWWCSIKQILSWVNEDKEITHSLFFQVQGIWFYFELFGPVGGEFCACDKHGTIWILLHAFTQSDQCHLLKMLYAFLASLSKNRVSVGVWIYEFSVWFHWFTCLFFFHYHAVFITITLLYSLRIGVEIPPFVILLLKKLKIVH